MNSVKAMSSRLRMDNVNKLVSVICRETVAVETHRQATTIITTTITTAVVVCLFVDCSLSFLELQLLQLLNTYKVT